MKILRVVLAVSAAIVGILVAIPFVLAWASFWLVAWLTRATASRLEPPTVGWPELVEPDPTVGWRPKADQHRHLVAGEIFSVSTGADGWRGRATLADSEIVVFGDSYAFGHGVDDRAFFADLRSAVRIKAIGSHGYNMVQELLWMRRLAPHLSNKLVVWFVFLGNDLVDNLEPSLAHRRMPFVRQHGADWEIVTDHVSAAKWPYLPARFRSANYERLTRCFSDGPVADRALSACGFLIARGSALCQEAGARLVVMTIPDPMLLTAAGISLVFEGQVPDPTFDPDRPDRRIGAVCAALGVPFVAGKTFLDSGHYLASDDHWNPAGHRRVAEALVELYEREMTALGAAAG